VPVERRRGEAGLAGDLAQAEAVEAAALTGQPLLMLLGVALAGVVLLLARRWPPRRLRNR
jgi:hypothetical protein